MSRAAWGILALVVVSIPAFAQDDAADPSDPAANAAKLGELRREIERREAKAEEYREQAEGFLGEIDAIDRQLAETRRSVRVLRERERGARAELATAEREVSAAGARLESVAAALHRRLVSIYKWSTATGLPGLYSAGDFQTLVRRRDGLTRIVAGDARLFESHRRARVSWEQSRARTQGLLDEIRVARAEVGRREDDIRAQLVERRNAVDLLRSRAEHEQRAAAELEEAAERLAEVIARLPDRYSPSQGSGLAIGATPRPVEGTTRLGFGRQTDPEFGTQTIRNGIEIAAPRGVDVRAVAPGRVLFAGWFKGYGRIAILDHGEESVTVSGYLESLAVEAGDLVRAGQVIGTVGDTGSLSGPALYFEIRDRGTPVDPERYLGP